jgi:hypothetical protein
LVCNQLKISVQCLEWSQGFNQSGSQFAVPSAPKVAKRAGVKVMLCVYGTENHLDIVAQCDQVVEKRKRLAVVGQQQLEQIHSLRYTLQTSIDNLARFMDEEGSVLPQNLCRQGSRRDTWSLDEMAVLPHRLGQIMALAKSLPKQKQGPFSKDHPIAVALTLIGRQLASLTHALVAYQRLQSQLDVVEQQLYERGGVLEEVVAEEEVVEDVEEEGERKDNGSSGSSGSSGKKQTAVLKKKEMWEVGGRGRLMLASTEAILLLVQKEEEEEDLILSSLLNISECKQLFLSFAVHSPTSNLMAESVATLVRGKCCCCCWCCCCCCCCCFCCCCC